MEKGVLRDPFFNARGSKTQPTRGSDRQQSRGNAALFRQQDVIGPAGSAGFHHIHHDASIPQFAPEPGWQQPILGPDPSSRISTAGSAERTKSKLWSVSSANIVAFHTC